MSIAAALIGAGYFGPHPAPPPTPSPATSLLAAQPTPASSGTPVPGTDALAGLTQVNPRPGQIKQTWLPGQITSQSMAVVAGTLYFIVGGDRIESTAVGADGSWYVVAQVSQCQGISQLAAAGHELAYMVVSPGGPTSHAKDCGGAGQVSWSVWLLDLNSGILRQVAQGVRAASSIDIVEFPIHLAVTDSAYAFNRPPQSAAAGLGEAVEVHAIAGPLLWTSHTQNPVADVMLGGSTLAILTTVSPGAEGGVDLYTSSAADPEPAPVTRVAGSASLSPDGMHLAWDVANQDLFPASNPRVEVAIETVGSGAARALTTVTDPVAPAPVRPSISSTGHGLVVTWFATAPDGAVYPAVRYAAGGNGAFLPSLQEPIWMSVQGARCSGSRKAPMAGQRRYSRSIWPVWSCSERDRSRRSSHWGQEPIRPARAPFDSPFEAFWRI